MWHDSFDNGEPLQLSQDNDTASYQLFGTLTERLSQDDFDDFSEQNMQQPMQDYRPRFPTGAWPANGGSWYIREFPSDPYCTPGVHLVQAEGHAQTVHAAPPQNLESAHATANNSVERKSAILNKIQNLRSTSSTLDEEIKEQKNRNAALLKKIAETKDQLSKMKTQSANLRDETRVMIDKNKEFELKLDQDTKQLTKTIADKRSKISEIKHDAEMIQTLREEKDALAQDIKELRKKLNDVDLDIYWMERDYKIDYDKMIIFPFWKLEEDLERAIRGEDPTLYKEEGPQERDHEKEGDGYDYEDHDFFKYDEEYDDDYENDEKTASQFQEDSPETDTWQSSYRKSKSGNYQSRSRKLANSKLGRRFSKFIANASFGRNAEGKKEHTKISKFSRFVHWLRRVIPKENRDN